MDLMELVVSGRVQGVGFRAAVAGQARVLELGGNHRPVGADGAPTALGSRWLLGQK
jgi:acylphosphatase